MKWIKAIDKFPIETKNYFLRHKYEDGRWHGWWAYIVPEAIDKGVWLNLNYEWLDESADEWVSVKDRLPDLETKVIVARPNRYSGKTDILMAYLHDSGERGRSCGRLGEDEWLYGKYWSLPAVVRFETITHWCPLPSPPKQ